MDLIKKEVRGKGNCNKNEKVILRGGDLVWVEYKDKVDSVRYKRFTGICIDIAKRGADKVLVLRSEVGGVGVEYGFHLLSKNIKEVQRVQLKAKKGGRAKQYNLREKN